MPEVSRRQFIKLMAVSAAGAVAYSGCTPFPSRNEFLTESPGQIPEDALIGGDNWFATVCRQCPAGCGTIVRVFQGRALKVEGNPDFPVNRGVLCPRGQASVQELYHPDRYRGPLRRTGERGSGQYERISWDEARAELLSRVRGAIGTGQAGLLMITEPLSGHRADLAGRLATVAASQHIAFEPLPNVTVSQAVRRVFGHDRLPHFDIARAKYLLSFGADFLGTWLSPAQYGRAYGEFRQGRPDRGYFVQVEPYLSQTGTNADEWLPVRPGTEGLVALSIAQALVSSGAADPIAAAALLGATGSAALSQYAPERVAEITGVPADRLSAIARAFASQRPALAIAGDRAAAHSNGLFNVTAIYALNLLVGNVGKEGGVLLNPPAPLPELAQASYGAPLVEWQKLAGDLRSGQRSFGLALIHKANPVHGLPRSLDFTSALAKVPFIVSFSSMPDETSDLADLILPDHVALEAWGDTSPNPGPGLAVIATQQPVVNPLYDTRDYMDVLLSLVPDLGPAVQAALPWSSFGDVVRSGVQQLQAAVQGTQKTPFEQFWNGILQKGGWWADRASAQAPAAAAAQPFSLPAQPVEPNFAGSPQDFGFYLQVFPHIGVGAGENAHLPWLQSMPDPMTTVAWRTWVQINPGTAKQLGLSRGDLVFVESTEGSVEAVVYPYPAIAPDVVAMPLGNGHQSMGRWAKGYGSNPISILAPISDSSTGALAWAATRVRIRPKGARVNIPVYEGDVLAVQPEHQIVVRIARQ